MIVAQSGEDYCALTADKLTVGDTDYLSGAQVTVSGSGELSGVIGPNAIWTFTADGSGSKVQNGGNYLTRKSGTTGSIYLTAEDEGASYATWIYDDPDTPEDFML